MVGAGESCRVSEDTEGLLHVENRLGGSDAVAAIILLEDGRFVLQHRDDIPGIWYPNHWGCFGGALNNGESAMEALKREIYEEIRFIVKEATYFVGLNFDLTQLGLKRYYRNYYLVSMTVQEYAGLELHEGQGIDAFPSDIILSQLRVTPYDSFALYLYRDRHRIGSGWADKSIHT